MDLRKCKVLVTGAGGFIGSHLAEELVRRGSAVRAFVRYDSMSSRGWLDRSSPEIARELEVVAGDIRDPQGLRRAAAGCDVVFHLAALIAIPYSYCAPDSYVATNVLGTLNLLQAARELSIEKVVHTSTSEVYGSARSVPITEEHPLSAQSPYAATKTGADQLALSFHASFGTPVALIRPFNVYGPRQSTRAFIPALLTQIARGERPIRLGALHPTRDWTYITDTIRGFLAVAESDRSVGEVINIGSNFEIAVGEVAQLAAELLGEPLEIATEPERLRPENSEVDRLWADTTKARELLGWEPLYGGREGFRRGLGETAAWFGDPENLKCYRPDAGYAI
jgi:NAD dependent epimerase/dehydratase